MAKAYHIGDISFEPGKQGEENVYHNERLIGHWERGNLVFSPAWGKEQLFNHKKISFAKFASPINPGKAQRAMAAWLQSVIEKEDAKIDVEYEVINPAVRNISLCP